MKRFDSRGLWLAVPCLIPLLVLAWPSFKAAAFPQYQPVVDGIHVSRTELLTNDPDDRCYIVTTYINHSGPRPEWWGKIEGYTESYSYPNGRYNHSHQKDMKNLVDPHFVDAQGKNYPWYGYGASFQLYDDASQRYVIHCDTCVSKDLDIEKSRFAADLKMVSGTVKIDEAIKLAPPLRIRQ